MLPVYLAAAGALQEMTAGREQQKRDAELQATAFRTKPWDRSINPESFSIHKADPLAAAVQGGMTGFNLDNQLKDGNAYRSYLASMTNKNTAATKGIDPMAPVDYAPTGVSPGSEDAPEDRDLGGFGRDLNNYNDGPRKQNRMLASTPYARAARLNGFVVV